MTAPLATASRWDSARSGRRSASLALWLSGLVGVVALPMMLLGGLTLLTQYRVEQDRIEAYLLDHARSLARLIDREFTRVETAAAVLGASAALARDDLSAFAAEMRATSVLLSRNAPAGTEPVRIRLLDATGALRLDTAAPVIGQTLSHALPDTMAAISTGRTQVSDLRIGPITRLPYVIVSVPVVTPPSEPDQPHTIVGAIGTSVPRSRLRAIVTEANLPAATIASIQDRAGITVTHSVRDAETMGQPALPPAPASVLSGGSGAVLRHVTTQNHSGTDASSVVAFARAPQSGFVVRLAMPESAILAPLRASLLRGAVLSSAVMAGGLLTALLLARRIVSAFHRVPLQAEHAPSPPPSLGLHEADELAAVLAATLAERERASAGASALFNNSPIGVVMLDADGHVQAANDAFLAMIGRGRDDTSGQALPWDQFVPSELVARDRAALSQALSDGRSPPYETDCLRVDGTRLPVLLSFGIVDRTARTAAAFLVDLTARRQAEAALEQLNRGLVVRVQEAVEARQAAQVRAAHAERIHALGQLAGGISHDFNNILQTIQGGAALLLRRTQDGAEVERLARLILETASRGAAVTGRLLAFARREELHAEPVDAGTLLAGIGDVLIPALGAGVNLQLHATDGLPPMLADKGQLETVLVNLGTNARDAMPDGGTLTLSADAEVVAPGTSHPADLAPGHYIRLSVQDNGTGMDPATLARVTEPFFTTKPRGQGTGLGLPMARGFAEQSGGGLSIESTLGAGTVVRLWLPAATDSVPHSDPDPKPPPTPQAIHGRILLVDDERMVRETLVAMLEESGFDVLACASGADALDLLRTTQPIDVLVTDLSMPGINGLALIRDAQDRRPGLPAVLLTGYSGDTPHLSTEGTPTSYALLRKPISAAQLVKAIKAALGGV
ncbi:MAG: ATP-binding protein [Acetobacteraceae bacterium]